MNWNNNTKIIGKSFLEFDVLSSTNDYAIDLFKKKKGDEGMVIFAHRQTNGRGQMGTVWESPLSENILMSVLLTPENVDPMQQFVLNKIVALAVRDFVADVLPKENVEIKWPNDIYLNRKKVAGILIQNILYGAHISASIVGIGLNVNQLIFDESVPNAVSLRHFSSKALNIKDILPKLFFYIEDWYLKLQRQEISIIDNTYESFLYLKGKRASFEQLNGDLFWGEIMGVSPFGKLKIKSEEQILSFDLKEIKFIK